MTHQSAYLGADFFYAHFNYHYSKEEKRWKNYYLLLSQ